MRGGGVNLTSSTPANASGKEVTSADFIKSNLLNYTTNSILEIPQDIKLELNNGTLTLKAGSKVYVPNGKNSDGSNKFDAVTIENDVTYSAVYTSSRKCYAIYDYSAKILQMISLPDNRISYDSTTNKVIHTALSDTVLSFPFALVVRDTTGIGSIEQVFNGFGYIGSTVFALPGVKGLIPNGRNADGTLKNIEFVINNVITRTITWNNSSGQELFIGKYNLNEGIEFISTSSVGQYYKQETEPSLIRYAMWYKPAENKVYRCDLDSNGNLIWKDNFPCYIGQWFTSATSPYPITKLTIGLPFHAVDWNDSSWLSGLGMPSNRYIDLTLGASGSTYTAPANGTVLAIKRASAVGQNLGLKRVSSNIYFDFAWSSVANSNIFVNMNVRKGDVFGVDYTASGTELQILRFYYAEGEQ